MRIRLRLTLWYLAVTLAVIVIFGLGTYVAMEKILYRAMDKELEIVSSAIERSFEPFFGEFTDLVFSPNHVNPYLEYYLIVYGNDDKSIYISPIAQEITFDLPPGEAHKSSYSTQVHVNEKVPFLRPDENGEVTFRIYARDMFYHNRMIGRIVVGLHIENIEASLEILLEIILIGMAIITVLIGLGSYLLTRQALYPVHLITQKANQISHSNLSERIKIYHEGDEIGELSTVLNKLLDRLQKAFESQQHFMGDAAHELKTPLAILRSHWEDEINNPALSAEVKEKLVQDVETISRLTHLINNLLFLSKTEEIRQSFEFETLRLDEVLRCVATDIKILAEMKSQSLNTDILPEVRIPGDRDRIFQLFFNLLDNSVKYTKEQGSIFLSLQQTDDSAVVEIRDNGVGISAKDLPHIFDRFYRIQKDRSRKSGGSGLGLSICRLIIETHSGSIQVESEEGKGSVFKVSLPIDKSSSA